MHTIEALLTKEAYSAEDWRAIAGILAGHAKGFNSFSVCVLFQENLVRLFVSSKKDLSVLSNGLDGISFRPVDEETTKKLHLPQGAHKIGFLKIPNGGNILDLRERYKVQEGKDLELFRLDVQRFGKRLTSRMSVLMRVGGASYCAIRQLALFPAHLLAIDFSVNTNYIRATVPVYVSLEKNLHIMQSENLDALFRIDAFPYASHDYFLHLASYEFDKHSFIIGSSGSGKSKFIQLYIDRLSRMGMGKQNYRIVVIDPHASLEHDLKHIGGSKVINFGNEAPQLFPDASGDITAATELTTTLFKSLLSDQYNPKLERVLRFSLYVLLTAQSMSMQMLKEFLTNLETRTQILEHVHGYIPANVHQFFGTDFNEMRTKYYAEAISPLVSMVDELQLQPSLAGESEQSLIKNIQENFLTVFSLNKVSMGEKVVKTVAGLLIQQIFLIAQSRVIPQKILLFVDEVSVVQNPALASILAEARKFNLFVILTQQYFGQIDKDLRDAILSNVINYYVFRVSEEDARDLEGNLTIELPPEVIETGKAKGLKETDLRVKLMTELSPREALVRIAAEGQVLPSFKARTLDAPIATASIDASTLVAVEAQKLPEKFQKKRPQDVASDGGFPALHVQSTYGPSQHDMQAVRTTDALHVPLHTEVQTETLKPISNLADLLASQSSSREKLRKNKE
jgi:hypothetical protein